MRRWSKCTAPTNAARAVDAGATIIGVNNRNLRTLQVDLDASREIAGLLPASAIGISESGLKTPADLQAMKALGYRAFLMGERFMIEPDPGAALAGLIESLEAAAKMTAIKICGITRREDAELAAAPWRVVRRLRAVEGQSARRDRSKRSRPSRSSLPKTVTPVGVFVDPTADEVKAATDAGIQMAQIHSDAPSFLRGVTIPVVRAVHLAIDRIDGVEPDIADELVLLDAHDPVKRGGTGKTARLAACGADRALTPRHSCGRTDAGQRSASDRRSPAVRRRRGVWRRIVTGHQEPRLGTGIH